MAKFQRGGSSAMSTVDPIKDKEDVRRLLDYLKSKSQRNYIMALFGFQTGLRITDILNLKVKDVKGKDEVSIVEEKREYKNDVHISRKLKKELDEYLYDKDLDDFIFKSRQGYNRPITRTQAWRIISTAAKKVGIKSRTGCHSLRKTFGFNLYQIDKDIVDVQERLGHKELKTTKKYIGISKEKINKKIDKLESIYF